MWIFSLLIIPVLYFIDIFQTNTQKSKSYVRYGISFLLAIIYSIFIMLVYSPREYIPVKLSYIFLMQLLIFVLPLLILFCLFVFISIKPKFHTMYSAIDFFTGFYTVFIPFYVLSYFKTYTFFSLFIIPFLFAATLFALSYSLSSLLFAIENRLEIFTIIISSFFLIISLIAACLIYSFWILGFSTFILILSVLAFIAFIIGLYFWKKNVC